MTSLVLAVLLILLASPIAIFFCDPLFEGRHLRENSDGNFDRKRFVSPISSHFWFRFRRLFHGRGLYGDIRHNARFDILRRGAPNSATFKRVRARRRTPYRRQCFAQRVCFFQNCVKLLRELGND